MGIGLVGATSIEQPHPSRQRRWHIQHRLAGGDQCASNAPSPEAASMAHVRGVKPAAKVEQPVALAPIRAGSQLTDHGLAVVEHRCGV